MNTFTNINLTFATRIIPILSLHRGLYLCEQILVCLSRAFMVTAFAQFIHTKIDCITGIMILLDAVTFVYPLHFAKMSSHWKSFECIKSLGPRAANVVGVEKIIQLFLAGFLDINVAYLLLKNAKTTFRPNASKRLALGIYFLTDSHICV